MPLCGMGRHRQIAIPWNPVYNKTSMSQALTETLTSIGSSPTGISTKIKPGHSESSPVIALTDVLPSCACTSEDLQDQENQESLVPSKISLSDEVSTGIFDWRLIWEWPLGT